MSTRLGLKPIHAFQRPPAIRKILLVRYNHDSISSPKLHDQPKILASIESGFKAEPIQQLPPDSKTQAKTALRQIGLVMRVIAYGAVGLGVTAVIGFLGIHAWVEFLELPPPGKFDRTGKDNQDLYGWDLELQGWGAGFKCRGTDPGMGWNARSLIRAAWVAQNWQSGQDGLQVQEPSDQKFSTSSSEHGTRLVDSAYLTSQTRLEEAISLIKQKKQFQQPLDPTLLELELCLANLSERIHTRSSLNKAYQIYSQISTSFIDSFNHQREENLDQNWKLVQAIRTIEKLFQVGLKIIDFERPIDPSRAQMVEVESEKKLLWAVNQALGMPNDLKDPAPILDHSESKTKEEPITKSSRLSLYSIFGSSDDNNVNGGLLKDSKRRLDCIQERLSQLCSQEELDGSLSPINLRLSITSLLKLSTHLVSINSTKNAIEVQKKIQDYIQKIINNMKEGKTADEKLQEYWLKSRLVLSNIYLSQLEQALNSSKIKIKTNTSNQTTRYDNDPKEILREIVDQLGVELNHVDRSATFEKKWSRSLSGRLSENFDKLIADLRSIDSII